MVTTTLGMSSTLAHTTVQKLTSVSRTILEASLATSSGLLTRLKALRVDIASAAQAVYDQWEQDEDGVDEEFGGGGICDEISREIGSILAGAGISFIEGGQDGDDHAFLYAFDNLEAYEVDIPPQIYERGSGYSWTKVTGVLFDKDDVQITPVNRKDITEDLA